MNFQLLGKVVTVNPNLESYNRYRIMFQKEAEKAVNHFQKLYQSNASLEDVIKKVPDQMRQCIQPAISRCIQILIDHGALSVDEDRFMELYSDILNPASEAYMAIQEQYAEIVLDEEQKDAYRTARRQGRAKWQGGGFGLGGALKGAAQAGALNMVTGAGHMLFNGIAKIGSSIAASSKMNQIFKNEKTREVLTSGLHLSVFNIHLALIDCLNKTGVDQQPINGIIEPADQEEASAILRNLPRINDPRQQRDAMIQSFQLDPYQEDWYRKALHIFGDHGGDLEKIERYFGITVIHDEKRKQLDKFAQELPLNSEAQAQLAIKKIEDEKARLSFSGETEQTKAVREAANRFDMEYRTVEGVTFSTRQEADASRAELQRIREIEQNIDYHNLDSLADGERKMKTLSSPLAAARGKVLHEKWGSLDVELRSVDTLLPDRNPIICKNLERAEHLRMIISELKGKLDACGTGVSSEPPLLQFKTELSSMDIPVEAKECYQKEVDRRLASIDLALRTALGKEYPSREEARGAQELYDQIQADFTNGNLRKHGDTLRNSIESADFSEKTRQELLEQLFQHENSREIAVSKVIGTVSYVILFAIMISSYFFSLSGTPEFAKKDVNFFGASLLLKDVETMDSLGFMDGLKNGLLIYGRCFGDIFRNGFFEYIGGFDYGLIGNILWGVLGLFWVVIKHFFLGIASYLVSLVVTFFQTAPLRYYLGYIIGSAIPISVSQFTFDKEEEIENVNRIKGWTTGKILLALLSVATVVLVVFYFAQQEL